MKQQGRNGHGQPEREARRAGRTARVRLGGLGVDQGRQPGLGWVDWGLIRMDTGPPIAACFL